MRYEVYVCFQLEAKSASLAVDLLEEQLPFRQKLKGIIFTGTETQALPVHPTGEDLVGSR